MSIIFSLAVCINPNFQPCVRLLRRCLQDHHLIQNFTTSRVSGLYGVGGIGKTTLCKSLCNDYRHKFNGKVWHAVLGENTAEETQKDVLRHLVGTSEALLKKNCKDQVK